MARFRPSPAAEALLASIANGEAQHGEAEQLDPRSAVAYWLAQQRVGRIRLTNAVPSAASLLEIALSDPWR